MFFTNIFRFSSRKAVCEHAYRSTRRQLLERRDELEPLLAEFGIGYRHAVIEDPGRNLWEQVGIGDLRSTVSITQELDHALTRLEALLERMEIAEPVAD